MYISITMGFWRNVGYLWGGLMILAGFVLLHLFPFGIVSALLGVFLIFILRHNAHEERIEEYMKRMADKKSNLEQG